MPCITNPHDYCTHGTSEIDRKRCDEKKQIHISDDISKRTIENLQDELNFYKKQANKVTDMLCRILSTENYGVIETRLDEETQEWWGKHQEYDKQRKEPK
jgi:hypothetical protein